jgi:hypothetical protein
MVHLWEAFAFTGEQRAAGDDLNPGSFAARNHGLCGGALYHHGADKNHISPLQIVIFERLNVHIHQPLIPTGGQHGRNCYNPSGGDEAFFCTKRKACLKLQKVSGNSG